MTSGPEEHLIAGGTGTRLRINRTSTAEQAADLLRNLIISGEIPAGEPLPEMHLAREVGVSRNTMRECLRMLSREGIISQDRHHVALVAEITADDVREVFAVRCLIECGAVEMLQDHIALDLHPLQAACERLRMFRDGDPWMSVIEADRDFHVALVALPSNPRLNTVYDRLESEIRLCLALTTRAHVSVSHIAEEHERILDHLTRGAFDEARTVLRTTMDAACETACKILESRTSPPVSP